ASFWYLKPFPIKQMATLVNYIVFMTYDLHGQWDAGSAHTIDGCPAGNCVRSHINLTETKTTLAMLTKAGVPPSKIFVGESSYGRSFKLAQAGCEGPMCTFLGGRTSSQAAPGRCTGTGGYLANAEIDEIIDIYPDDAKSWHDGDTNSDMLLYGGGVEWVAYMTPLTKRTRRDYWKSMGFAGTVDWAVDLQSFTIDEQRGPNDDKDWDDEELPPPLSKCQDAAYATVDDVQNKGDIPFHCRPVYLAEVLSNTIKKAMTQYDDLIKSGYDRKFNTYADAVVEGGDKAVRTFMYDNGNKYFDCKVWEAMMCCKRCHYYYGQGDECRYCDDKYCGQWKPSCENRNNLGNCGAVDGWMTVEPECPPDYSKRAGHKSYDDYTQSIDWRPKESKKADFWADLYTAIGIEEKDIKFKDVQRRQCSRGEEVCRNSEWDFNFPVTEGFQRADVLNPKDVVQKAYKGLQGFVKELPAAVAQMRENRYMGSAMDLVDAIALPVFMVEQAVSAIQEISDTVDEWDRQKRESIILIFLTAIFFFVPVVGELAGMVASLANVARIMTTLGVVGSAALDVYGVVSSANNGPLDIFGLVLAPLAVLDAAQMAKAAARARSMKQDEVQKLGSTVAAKLTTVRKHMAPVCTLPTKRDIDIFAASLR
ncbi:killer toxin subunits alpha/beta, partial [Staphylotrichum tortipilum]